MDTIDINTKTLLINTFINYNKCEFPYVSSKQIVYVEKNIFLFPLNH